MRRSRVPSLPVRALIILLAAGGAVPAGLAQDSRTLEMPLHRRQGDRLLVSDLQSGRILMLTDLDGDGTANGPGEITVFFDTTNLSGLPGSSASVFSIYQAADGTVYFGDIATRAVYALRDNNLDGDALDLGEATLFYAQQGDPDRPVLSFPHGIAGDATSLFISASGASTSGALQDLDSVLRLSPVPGGPWDALSAAAATRFADLTGLYGGTTGSTANPFDIVQLGGTVWLADFRTGGTPGRAFMRLRDTAAPFGQIDAAEIAPFTTGANTLGVPVSQTLVTDGTALYVHNATATQPQDIWRLLDGNNNGTLDAGEAVKVWAEADLPSGVVLATSNSIAVGLRRLALTTNAQTSSGAVAGVIVATDGGGGAPQNGYYGDGGETRVFALGSAANPLFPTTMNLRRVVFYGWPCPADFNRTNGVDLLDIFAFLDAWFQGNPRADINGAAGVDLLDIFDFLGRWFGGC